tara:strand:- start:32300 stop:33190 length:891 start_codon:yes stop_codon:yes gene_type:complete
MKILIFGSNGQLGKELALGLTNQYEVYSFDKKQVNINNHESVSEIIRQINPKIIINCASYTSVDKAERNKNEAFKTNHLSVKKIAKEAKKHGILFIHFSTDYVFDGKIKGSYLENDITNPLNIYGKSKLEGEKEIILINGNYIILRTSWVIGKYGVNFAKKIIKSIQNKNDVKVVNDCFGSPTSTKLILKVIRKIIIDFKNKKNWDSGIYHLSSKGFTSWYEMATLILELINIKSSLMNNNKIVPISIASLYKLADRPKNSSLNTTKIQKSLNFTLPYWKDDFSEAIKEIIKDHPL